MDFESTGLSDRGPARATNEDCFCIGPFVEQESLALAGAADSQWFTSYGLLAAVADGIGGYHGGEVASRLVLEALSAHFYGQARAGCSREQFEQAIGDCLRAAQDLLRARLERSPDLRDAGTTIAGIAAMPPDLLVVFHAGDSRVLRASGGYVRALTVDHTPLGGDLAAGLVTDAAAAEMPASSTLTRSLGLHSREPVELQTALSWAPGDLFLIGTDGWHGAGRGLAQQEVLDVVRASSGLREMVPAMLDRAIAADGHDNATLVAVRFTSGGAHG